MSITWSAGGSISGGGGPMAYGRVGEVDTFVAVTNGFTRLAYSTDGGATWTDRTPAFTGSWNDVTFGNGVFVAVSGGAHSAAATSPDGINWTARTLPETGVQYASVVYGNGRFVAFPYNKTYVATSDDDGATWVQRNGFTSGSWLARIYANGMFVVAQYPGTVVLRSTDGETWTSSSVGNGEWDGIAYGAAGFLLTEGATSSAYYTSPDAVTWTARTFPAAGIYRGVAADQSGNYIVPNEASSYWSADGLTWSTFAMTASDVWRRPAVSYNKIVVSGSSFGTVNTASVPQDHEAEGTDTALTIETTTSEITTPVSVGASAADSLEATELLIAVSGLVATTPLAVQTTWIGAVADILVTNTTIRLVFEVMVAETADVADLLAGDPIKTVALAEALRFADSSLTMVAALAAISEALAMIDSARSVVESNVVDAADVADLLSAMATAYEHVVVGAAFADTLSGLALMSVVVPEDFDVGAEATAVASWLANASDGADFSISFTFDGEPYFATSMNAANRGVTEYVNFNFNSVATFNDTLYGAGDAGLYRHGGDTDAGVPITAYLRTAMQRLAQGQVPGVSDAYLGFRGNGQLQLKVVVRAPRGGKQNGYVFDLIQSPAGAPLPGRFKIGKGLQSVYMAFELGNVAGSDFAIDVMEIRPLVSYRRLP